MAFDDRDARIREHFEAIGKDAERAASIYAEDAVLEYIQSNERIRGVANIMASRAAYPGRPTTFEVHRTFGTAELQAAEITMHLEGDMDHPIVAILEFRGDLVIRERIYIADPWEPAPYRAQWAEPLDRD